MSSSFASKAEPDRDRVWRGLTIGSVLLSSILVLAAALSLPVIQDEAYYWTWSRSVGWHYYDHPPGVAWILALGTSVFGSNRLGLRAFSLIAMLVIAASAVAAARRLASDADRDQAGRLALLLLLGSPMYLVGSIPGTHDPLLAAVCAVGALLFVRAFQGDRRALFLSAGVLALGVMFKHYAALIVVGAFVGLGWTAAGRRLLSARTFWLGVLLAALPVATWLAVDLTSGRDSSLSFQAARVFLPSERWRTWQAPLLVLGSVVLTLGPVGGLGLLYVTFARPGGVIGPLGPSARVLGLGAGMLVLGCVVAVCMGGGEANWPFPAFTFALPLIAVLIAARPRLARWSQGTALALNVGLLVYLAHVVHPFLPIPERKDPAVRGAGFERLARSAREVADEARAEVLVTHRYQPASLFRYHLHDELRILELGSPGGRRSQFDVWPRPALCPGDHVVVVLQGERLPPELEAEGLAAPRKIERLDGAEPWWVTPAVIRGTGWCSG